MIVSLVYAQSQNGVIGIRNELPWRLPADLEHFKDLTTGHTIVMGRKTYESIGRALPNRRSVVVSRNPRFRPDGVDVVVSLDEALRSCEGEDEVFVIGGAELFRAAVPQADRVYRTVVHATLEGDVTLPEIDHERWTLVESNHKDADERNVHPVTFQRFNRRRPGREGPEPEEPAGSGKT